MTVEFHPLCMALPDMADEPFKALVEDIRVNGLRHDIVLFEGAILDGRHRYRACLTCGVVPRFVTFDGDDPLAFIISENVTRRHLSESQRAMVASRLANRPVGGTYSHSANLQNEIVTRDHVAKLLSVSDRTIANAVRVREAGIPDLIAKVDGGAITVHEAAKIASLNPKAQARLVAIEERKPRQRELSASLNRSASRNRVDRPEVVAPVEATVRYGSQVLVRLERFATDSMDAAESPEEFANRCVAEMDWDSPRLKGQLMLVLRATAGICALDAALRQAVEARA
ncbi:MULTISPECIES: ParB/RepB/Spo0J family partition protein [unclassified Lysobacter]|uniref:ParB/RepB/Spo0J family partition protein n=1 Tax=unclassified Lysobacter TaxID=2635362 RepID=UPI001BE5985C|nr:MULTISPECIES: ParB/RepB/Spo0J family partition protein [unclassified Lysobacter]MBT2748370.1 hypothetical protein [Lysobacter sp. ISL-42]MBT2749863.1 hypothetical protein [Lysobacter sp. ISL-50]MBT2781191.1 hypothetical protein [Lysobacter sp. ISL-52]